MKILDRRSPAFLPLARRTTLRLGGFPLAEIRLVYPADYDLLPPLLEREGFDVRILGGGSNLLADDGNLPFAVIRPLNGMGQSPEHVGPDLRACGEERVLIRAGAGLRMPALLAWCAARGLSGLEGLVGVPGRLGGAIAMNAGAYGCSLAPLLRELTVFSPAGGLLRIGKDGWTASYRHFALAGENDWFIAVEAVLSLAVKNPSEVRAHMAENLARKISTQPVAAHTAGCVFRNPPECSAGKLLDDAGMKGVGRGGMRFSDMHANFLVNEDGGSCAAALDLIAEAREKVARTSGVNLEMEIKVWS